MSQQLRNTKGQEDDKGQEQSRSAPLQRVPATFAKLATRIRVPRFLAGFADTQLSAGVGTTTTSLPARVQRQKQVSLLVFFPMAFRKNANPYQETISQDPFVTWPDSLASTVAA